MECYGAWGCFGGNPDLEPEEALNRELGVAWERNGVGVDLTYFNNRIKNLIDWSTGIASNVGRADIQGIEAALSATLATTGCAPASTCSTRRMTKTGDQLGSPRARRRALALERAVGQDLGVEERQGAAL